MSHVLHQVPIHIGQQAMLRKMVVFQDKLQVLEKHTLSVFQQVLVHIGQKATVYVFQQVLEKKQTFYVFQQVLVHI